MEEGGREGKEGGREGIVREGWRREGGREGKECSRLCDAFTDPNVKCKDRSLHDKLYFVALATKLYGRSPVVKVSLKKKQLIRPPRLQSSSKIQNPPK